jgi:hypothetical protein
MRYRFAGGPTPIGREMDVKGREDAGEERGLFEGFAGRGVRKTGVGLLEVSSQGAHLP